MGAVGWNKTGELRLHRDIEFQTPYNVCQYMASLIPEGVVSILEPTPGIGNLIAAVEERFNNVNITAPDDFFLLKKQPKFDVIIMNPPFTAKSADLTNAPDDVKCIGMRLGYYILTECMKLSNEVIALMPWFTISDSDIRLKALVEYGIKAIIPLPRKTFRYARIQTVIIHLVKGYRGETRFNPIFHRVDDGV